jgi:hypothetical protein
MKDSNKSTEELIANMSLDDILRIKMDMIKRQQAELLLAEEKIKALMSPKEKVVNAKEGTKTEVVLATIKNVGTKGITSEGIALVTGYTLKQARDVVTRLINAKRIHGEKLPGTVSNTYYFIK